MNFRLPKILLLAGAPFLLAACTSEPPAERPAPGAEAAAPMTPAIENIEWQRVTAEGPASTATLRFEGGRVHGFSGCNRFVGGYVLDGDRIRLDSLAGTMMACEPAVMAAESAFLAALGGAQRVSVDAGRLTLAGADDASPPLVFEPAPPPRLDGVNWEVTGFNNGRQAVVGVLADTTLQLAFDEQAVYGHAGCNRFRAAYSIDGNTISIEPPAATRMFCGGEGVMEQEQQFLAALASATTWSIERGMLDMHRGDGERVLTARDAGE
jgi:heat shock protein HslJ